MTPKQLAEEGLRERLLEAVLAHTGVQPGWPHYDAGRVVVLVLDAIEPAIKAEFKAQAEEFRRVAAKAKAEQKRSALGTPEVIYKDGIAAGVEMAMEQAALMLEEKLNG